MLGRILLLMLCNISCFSQQVDIAFRVPEKDLIPEGITHDPTSGRFFISSINKKKIVEVDKQLKAKDFIKSEQDGIGEVLGMKVDTQTNSLWACSNLNNEQGNQSSVHQFDLQTGKLIRKWTYSSTEEKHLFNDLVISNNGEAYVSDSYAGAVIKISSTQTSPEFWLKNDRLRGINGISILRNGFIVVNASNGFFTIDPTTKEIKWLPFGGYLPMGIDGLYTYKNSLIGIQNLLFPISINQYYLDKTETNITHARVLLSNHDQFDIPTTGTIVDDWFYFIANSQLLNYNDGKILSPDKLNETIIMRIKID